MTGDRMDELHVRDASWSSRAVHRWQASHTFDASRLPDRDELLARKRSLGTSISVGIPALDEQDTIAGICGPLVEQLAGSLVDEVVVIDGGSRDETAARARDAGAEVVEARALVPLMPGVGGKGDSLWRSLAYLRGDIVVWIDADIREFDPAMVARLVAPLLLDEQLFYVKGFYDRPIDLDGALQPGGGRVTELLARPLLSMFFPELTGFRQPLAGEYAGRREALMRVPFLSGYSVEVGLLIDLLEAIGLGGMAQVDLTRRVHRNRPLDELAPMAHAIAGTIVARAAQWGRVRLEQRADPADEAELPPMDELLARIAAGSER